MGQGFDGGPNTYNFGYDFDYSLWVPGSQIDLIDVPWNNDYRDVVKFTNRAGLDSYINSRVGAGVRVTQVSYIKPQEPVRIDVPHNVALRHNYLRATNPLQPIAGDIKKNYYYFILDTKYVAPNTTELVLQLDVWQTYIYEMTFGNCYIERGHIGIANENAFNHYGRDYLTVPEGMDMGSEYQIITKRDEWVMTPTPIETGDRYPGHDVLVIATADLEADAGTVEDPKLVAAEGTSFQGTTQGAAIYIFDPQQFSNFLHARQDQPWVTQSIISVTMIPRIIRYNPEFDYGTGVITGTKATTFLPRTISYNTFLNWREATEVRQHIPARYRHLLKFFTFPYMLIEMTTFTATPLVIKPEMWNSPDGRIFERACLLPPGQRIEFAPKFYNSKLSHDADQEDLYPPPWNALRAGVKGDDVGEYLDFVTSIANFPTMSLVNNGQLGYLASNVHGIAYQKSSADWSQQRSLYAAQSGYDVATTGMWAAQDIATIGIQADIGQTGNINRTGVAQAIVSGVAGIGGGAAGGGIAGPAGAGLGAAAAAANGVGGVINAGIQTASNDEALAIRNAAAQGVVSRQNQQTGFTRDTNRAVANFAARGDYANQIAGINAKVQDAAMLQNNTSGQIGGEAMNMINGGWQFSLRWKLIDPAAIAAIGDFWLRYGYSIRRFVRMPASLMVMTRFTYWKCLETYITGSDMPESHKQSVRGIFEKGVTVWANPADIGVVDIADNDPLDGISY